MSGGRHKRIILLVPATSETQAVARAEVTSKQLARATTRPVQSFSQVRVVSAEDRTEQSEERIGPVPAKSESGGKLLETAIQETEESFQENFQAVRDSLETYDAEEILRNKDNVRHRFLSVGAFVGPGVSLYTHDGQPVRCRSDLLRYETNHDSLWIVPAEATVIPDP